MDWLQMGVDVAKGAAAGSVVPGVGTVLGAAGGIALNLAPEIGQWLFGPGSEPTIQAVEAAVKTATGSDNPEDQMQAIADPAVAANLRIELARITAARATAAAQAAHDQLVAQLADIAGARATTVQLAQAGSPMAWGATVVSIVVLGTFGAVMALTLLRAIPENAEPVLNVLLGSLTAMATSVVAYWVGSSVGSARKDDRLANILGTSLRADTQSAG